MQKYSLLLKILRGRKMEWVLIMIAIFLAGGGIKFIYERHNRRDRDDEDKKNTLLKKKNNSYQSCDQQMDIYQRPTNSRLEAASNLIVQAVHIDNSLERMINNVQEMRSDIKKIKEIKREGLEKQEEERQKQEEERQKQEQERQKQEQERQKQDKTYSTWIKQLEAIKQAVEKKNQGDRGQYM